MSNCVMVLLIWLWAAGVISSEPDNIVNTLMDEFDILNMSRWQHEMTLGGGGNWEFQFYTNNRSNSYVKNGVLYIKPTLLEDTYGPGFATSGVLDIWGSSPADQCTGNAFYGCSRTGSVNNPINPIMSARLRSVNSFNFKYGHVEVRAQMPKGDWIWPAIWLLPVHNAYGSWPSSGEIDMVESRGNRDYNNTQGQHLGCNHASSALHWGPFFAANKYQMTTRGIINNAADDFHIYTLNWTSTGIVASIDGNVTISAPPSGQSFWEFGGFNQSYPGITNPWQYGSTMAPFDQPFYIVMNVAVGGTGGFFHDSLTNGGYPKPWSDSSPNAFRDFWNAKHLWYPTWKSNVSNGEEAALKIDYIRVYSYNSAGSTITASFCQQSYAKMSFIVLFICMWLSMD